MAGMRTTEAYSRSCPPQHPVTGVIPAFRALWGRGLHSICSLDRRSKRNAEHHLRYGFARPGNTLEPLHPTHGALSPRNAEFDVSSLNCRGHGSPTPNESPNEYMATCVLE